MNIPFHYATLSEALQELHAQGFTIDFNLPENRYLLKYDELEIVDVYRYEGDSDPGDEVSVYALQAQSGIKGVLVAGYGISEDNFSSNILKKLHQKH